MKVYKSVFTALFAYILVIIIQTLAAFASIILLGQDNKYFTGAAMLIYSTASFVVFLIWYLRVFVKTHSNIGESALGLWGKKTAKVVLTLIVIGIAIQFFASSVLELCLIPFPEIAEKYMSVVDSLVDYDIFLVVYVCIMGPLCEEFVFRGVIMAYFSEAFGVMIANILQAVLFGLYHGNVVQGIYAFILGAFIGLFRNKTGKMWGNCIVHVSINVMGYIIEMQGIDFTSNTMIACAMITSGIVLYGMWMVLGRCILKDNN